MTGGAAAISMGRAHSSDGAQHSTQHPLHPPSICAAAHHIMAKGPSHPKVRGFGPPVLTTGHQRPTNWACHYLNLSTGTLFVKPATLSLVGVYGAIFGGFGCSCPVSGSRQLAQGHSEQLNGRGHDSVEVPGSKNLLDRRLWVGEPSPKFR